MVVVTLNGMGVGWLFSLFGKNKRTSGPGISTKRKLYIPEGLHRRMINHCTEEVPLEACGLLVGEGGQVMSAFAADNEHRSPVIYKVDDRQLLHVYRTSLSEKQEIIGIYHSHVRTEAIPSRTDIEQATWPEACYVIVSLAGKGPQVRAWRMVDRQVAEHQVIIQKDVPGTWHDLRQAVRASAESDKRNDIP